MVPPASAEGARNDDAPQAGDGWTYPSSDVRNGQLYADQRHRPNGTGNPLVQRVVQATDVRGKVGPADRNIRLAGNLFKHSVVAGNNRIVLSQSCCMEPPGVLGKWRESAGNF